MVESVDWMDQSLAHDDFKEGVASFVERRPPNFSRIKVDWGLASDLRSKVRIRVR